MSEQAPIEEIPSSLSFLLHRATVLVDRAADRFLVTRHGIGYPLFSVLLLVGSLDRPIRAEIAAMLGVSRASITQRTAELAKRGLIVGEPSDEDARTSRLRLTAEGGRLLEAAWRDLETADGGLEDGIDIPQLTAQLLRLTANAERFLAELSKGPDDDRTADPADSNPPS